MKPKVSVIIPAYNGERYITQTVASVLAQTYTNYEIIVVDDGSIDNTKQVLTPYLEQIHYVYQSNLGVAAARNRGLELATGELIAFLDHDDVYLPEKLALQVACLLDNPHIGMVHTGWRRINHQGETLGNVEPWHNVPYLRVQDWLKWMPILLSAMLFRRDWLLKVGGFDTSFKQAADVDLVQNLALQGCSTAWVRQITVCYREHDHNDSWNTLIQAQETMEVRRKFFRQPSLAKNIRKLEQECFYHTLVWIAWRLYYTGYTAQMFEHLEKSLQYTPFSPSKTVSHWINFFQSSAQEYNFNFDIYKLINSQEWKRLISKLLALP